MNKYQDREITKIVCFCAFNDSYVVEHLQNEDSYLLKLCRDPANLEQMVDSIHPDIILIDSTGKISGSNETQTPVFPLNIVKPSGFIESASGCIQPEEPLEPEEILEAVQNLETEKLIHLPDYLPDHLHIWDIAQKYQIIFIFDSDPGMAVRLQCLENRSDVMVAPFPFEELNFRIRLHVNQKELNQQISWQKDTLNRALEHIDNLKQIVFGTRKAWSSEKNLLHNSLKQINMMTSDRDTLKKELRDSRIKLSENIKGINSFLCNMVESRNEYQKGHSKRVAEIAEFVAERVGVEPKSIRVLKNAAMLHEVGMLLIPSSILNKEPSLWSDYEKNMIIHHPSKGAAYLAKCPGFEKVAGIIRHLHENSDGTGYPEGLKKRYIPLLSKLLAGADVLDQIWIDNPYSSADRLLELLEEQAGSRLDPSIVNFLEKYVVTTLNFQINRDQIINCNQMDDNHSGNKYVRLKEIPVYQLRPGMVTGAGLFTKTGTKLFSSGTTLTEDSIRMIEQYTKEYPVDETVFIKFDS